MRSEYFAIGDFSIFTTLTQFNYNEFFLLSYKVCSQALDDGKIQIFIYLLGIQTI